MARKTALDPTPDFVAATLAGGPYTTTSTVFTLQTGDGTLLPDPTSTGDYYIVGWNAVSYVNAHAAKKAGQAQVLLVTAKSGDQVTATQGQLGTTAVAMAANWILSLGPLSWHFDDIKSSLPINVKRFGAKGDDSTDDTAAINRAIAEVNTFQADGFTSGITLLIPPGIYKTTAPLNPVQGDLVHVTGGGILKGYNFSGFVLTMGAGGYLQQVVSRIGIWLEGTTTGGLLLHHNRGCLIEAVKIRNDYVSGRTGQVGLEVRDGVYVGLMLGGQIRGTMEKAAKITTGSFAVPPHGFAFRNVWFAKVTSSATLTALSIEAAVADLETSGCTFDSYDIGVNNASAEAYLSHHDRFDGTLTGFKIAAPRQRILFPTFSGATLGISLLAGSYDSVIAHPHRWTNPTDKLIRIASGVLRTRIACEWADLTHIDDQGPNTVYDHPGKELTGTAAFVGAAVSVTVTFDSAVDDANYDVLVAGRSNNTYWVLTRTTTSFNIQRATGGSDETVGWKLIRGA